jgi:hypothetical protein
VVFADGADLGSLEDWTADHLGLWLAVVPRLAGTSTFVVLPKRSIVGRSLAWLTTSRHLVCDFEATTSSSEA